MGVAETAAETALLPSEIDIYRSARLLIDQHGDDAPIFAAMQADRRAEAGDMEGRRVWLRVIRAMEKLLNTGSRDGREALH